MVLSTEWSQVEVIDLVNDGSGLGFGIVGGRSTGVVVKSILPGGIADRDGRLQSGDHILQIGDVQTRGLASEHVATILRQCSLQVRIVVARPVEPTTCGALGSDAPIVPTKTLTDPDELETLLMQQNGYPQDGGTPSSASVSLEYEQQSKILDALTTTCPIISNVGEGEGEGSHAEHNEAVDQFNEHRHHSHHSIIESPESETIQVHLEKNSYGLGITVAGYVWEREDLSGIFVKGISEGSAAHLSGQIHLNDRIVEVDRQSLRGVTNHEAVEMLRRTGNTVQLVLERYLRGPRYEHLLNALQADHPAQSITNNSNTDRLHISPSSPSITTLSWFPVHTADCNTDTFIEPEPESHTTIDSLTVFEPPDPDTVEVFVDPHFESGSITPDLDLIVKKRWNSLIGDGDTEIVVAQLRKLRGLGISLEGTVDVEDGVELRPRHFIRSILPEGPVGRNGKLNTGDELLEVNGQKLLGRNHVDVVKILKELPETVRIVCARNHYNEQSQSRVINTAQDREGFAARNLLSGSLRTLLNVVNAEEHQDQVQDESLNNTTNTSSTATLADVDFINGAPISTEDDLVLIHENGYNSTPPEDQDIEESFLKNETDQFDGDHHENGDHDEFENHVDEEGTKKFDCDDNKNHQNGDHDGFQKNHDEFKCHHEDDFKNVHNGAGHADDDDDDDKKHEDCSKNELKNHQDGGIHDQLKTQNGVDNDQLKNQTKIENEEFEKEIAEEKIFNKEMENKKYEQEQMESSDCSPPKLTKHHHHQNQRSKSSSASRAAVMECVTYLAIWKQEIEFIELYKGNKGLGFSILDYQDPLDPNGTVIVVRSLVHGGCAELDGRLRPGDRIMCVNNISLKNVTLEYAVKALKGTALGPVRIGFSKPMPLTKQHTTNTNINTSIATASEDGTTDDDDNDDDQTQHSPLSIQDNYFIW